VMRMGDRLLGIDAVGEPWILRRGWLQVVHPNEARDAREPVRYVRRRPREPA
jgi:hypothetical protein